MSLRLETCADSVLVVLLVLLDEARGDSRKKQSEGRYGLRHVRTVRYERY